MKPVLGLALLCLLSFSPAMAQGNLVVNGDMELDDDGDGVPDNWQAAGDAETVTQRLTRDTGRGGGFSARLDCTRLVPENPASHAMICQMGHIALEKGRWYRFSFWARHNGLEGVPVLISLVDTRSWSSVGLSDAFAPADDWGLHEFVFEAVADGQERMRLQLCYLSTGTLWIDDVSLVPGDGRREPTLVWPDLGGRNLLPNGGFECGTDGWGSAARYTNSGWHMPMNRLFGELEYGSASEGDTCLKVAMAPGTTPVAYFDCMEAMRSPARAVLTGNMGWVPTSEGQDYCLSAYLRADAEDCPARLVIQPFGGAPVEREVRVGTRWARYELCAPVPAAWCSVLVGPDLRGTDRDTCTLWLDALQFEQGKEPSAFVPRSPVEAGMTTHRRGNIFYEGDDACVELTSHNRGAGPAEVVLSVIDFDDREVATHRVRVPAGEGPTTQMVDLGLTKRGFYRVHLSLNGVRQGRGLRMAIIPRYGREDSIFGMNHAYPWDHLLASCVDAGLLWVRDWSLKWHDVQRQPGPFDFSEADHHINRPLTFGQPVLGLLPFPASNWSSAAPDSVPAGDGYPALGGRTAYAPRSDREFSDYVRATVAHYRGRIAWWQVFNEPLYTNHALPETHGYSGRDYGRLVELFSQAARAADPDCKILAGIGGWPDGVGRYFAEMFETGALSSIDAVDVHTYPGLAGPESREPGLHQLRSLMEQHGGVKPIWLTEHGYYADDDVEVIPARHGGFDIPLPDERTQAIYSMRFNVILLANGVERILYHAGTCPGLNGDNREGTFFEYGGAPRRIYAAVAAFAELFPPGCRAVGELDWGPGLKAYLFETPAGPVLAAWRPRGEAGLRASWDAPGVRARDIMGNVLDQEAVALTEAPVFITGRGMTPEALRDAMRPVRE